MKLSLEQLEEQIFFTTVRIVSRKDGGKGSSIGTGFLYQLELENNKSLILLVSNKHVLEKSNELTLVFHEQLKTRKAPKLGKTITYNVSYLKGIYYEHPDKSVDLACINVSAIATNTRDKAFFKFLNKDIVLQPNEARLHAGTTVLFVGYPENRFDIKNNLPILRSGTVASIPSIDFNGNKQFIIDAQVFPGSSGSPVLADLGSRYSFIGIVSQTMIRHKELQTVPTVSGLGVEQVLGIGIVIKVSELNKLFKYISKRFNNT